MILGVWHSPLAISGWLLQHKSTPHERLENALAKKTRHCSIHDALSCQAPFPGPRYFPVTQSRGPGNEANLWSGCAN